MSRARAGRIAGATEQEVGAEWLRYAAATEYVTSLKGISVRQLHTQHPYSRLKLDTMERWCVEDDWVKRRHKYFQEIHSEAEAQLREKLIRARVDQLAKMEDIAVRMADKILAGVVEPKSEEGMVTALVRLLDSSEALREKMAQAIMPLKLGGMEQDTLPMVPKLTDAEARAAATAILQQRRLQTRQKTGVAPGEKKSKRQPKLRVVEGGDDA